MVKNDYYIGKVKNLIIAVIAIIIVQNIALYLWVKSKENAVVINLNGEGTEDNYALYPIVDYIPNSGPYGARLYYFLTDYIKWRFEETTSEYEKLQVSDEYSLDYIRKNFEMALAVAEGSEYNQVRELLVKSADRYRDMKRLNYQKFFNIDAFENVVYAPDTGLLYVSVLGEFTLAYDRTKLSREQVPDEAVTGYVRISFIIKQSFPQEDSKGNVTNPYGFYILETQVDQNIGYDVQQRVFQQKSILGYNDDMNVPFMKQKGLKEKMKKEARE